MVKSDIFENLQNCSLVIVYFDQQNALNKIKQSNNKTPFVSGTKCHMFRQWQFIKNKYTSAACRPHFQNKH